MENKKDVEGRLQMEIYQTWQDMGQKYNRLVVGLGNFDGVHLGHQKLIGELVAVAKRFCGVSAVFTFHPHPVMVLNPEQAPSLLMTQDVKEKMISKLGVDILFRVPFTQEFARLEPEEFIDQVLCRGLNVWAVLVGYNYTFGYQGRGTTDLLKEYSYRCDYELQVIPPVIVDQQVVSSTLIRDLLKDGEVAEAAKYLGFPPFFEGVVIEGDRRGSVLGFPTANLESTGNVLLPAKGVYMIRVSIDGDMFLGVANIGSRPTFYGYNARPNVEVHLLDFSGDLYGKVVSVHFTRRLRGEKKFASPEELALQIKQDIQIVRESIRSTSFETVN